MRLREAWRCTAAGAVFAAPAAVPGSGAVVLAGVEGVLQAVSFHGAAPHSAPCSVPSLSLPYCTLPNPSLASLASQDICQVKAPCWVMTGLLPEYEIRPPSAHTVSARSSPPWRRAHCSAHPRRRPAHPHKLCIHRLAMARAGSQQGDRATRADARICAPQAPRCGGSTSGAPCLRPSRCSLTRRRRAAPQARMRSPPARTAACTASTCATGAWSGAGRRRPAPRRAAAPGSRSRRAWARRAAARSGGRSGAGARAARGRRPSAGGRARPGRRGSRAHLLRDPPQ